ncbi:ABC transporter ATP-binding protein [Arenicellales bacterium IMCC58067]
MTVLSVNNLGKSFREYQSEWHRFARWFGLPVKQHTEHWVLQHISFEIHPGEAIGIVGQNGAGKSTLLKMITGTLYPSEGTVAINGRISAILELGMGFNPELSGRENARHASGLMGFSAAQIQDTLPEIEAFAEIGEYFDEPVRTYSSGMQMRVAFAVATGWRPEILIVDEALSVGDAYFQHKCYQRIREFQDDGTSLLIVSHDRSAILGLCSRAILLENGAVIRDGNPEEVFDFYNAILADKEGNSVQVSTLADGRSRTSSGTGEVALESIELINSKGEISDYIAVGEEIELRITARINEPIEKLVMGYGIKDRLGQVMFGINTHLTRQVISSPTVDSSYLFSIKFAANFGVGSYSIQTAFTDSETHLSANYEWLDMALMFNVANVDQNIFVGCLWNEPIIKIKEQPQRG